MEFQFDVFPSHNKADSHVALEKRSAGGYWRTIVPLHRELRPGTLRDILNQTGLSKQELADLL